MTILQEKQLLIQAILRIQDVQLLAKMKTLLFPPSSLEEKQEEWQEDALIYQGILPIPESISIETLKTAQNYQPTKVKKALQQARQIEWKENESVVNLLNSLH